MMKNPKVKTTDNRTKYNRKTKTVLKRNGRVYIKVITQNYQKNAS